jgi:hypothetical protein
VANGQVSLNGQGYSVRPSERNGQRLLVHRGEIPAFGEVYSQSGVQGQDRINSYTAKLYPSSSAGFGRNRTASDSALVPGEYTHFWDSTCETRFVNDRRLPILEEDSTETGLEVIRASATFKFALWAIWEDTLSSQLVSRVYDASSTAWSGGATFDSSTLVGLDLIGHKTHLISLQAVFNDHIISRSTDGATWAHSTTVIPINLLSNNVSAHEEIDAGLLAEIGGDAVALIWHESNGTITFYSSTDAGDVWVDESVDIASGNGPQGVAVLTGPDSEDKLILGTREGIYEIDTAPSTWTTRLIHPMVPHSDNCRKMTVHSDGSLWFAQGVSDDAPAPVFRMFADTNGYHVGPVPNSLHLHDGVPEEMLGPIRWMKSSQGFMYVSIGGGKSGRNARILCHNGKGWHSMRRHGTENQKIEWIDVSSDDDGNERLHYSVRTAADTSNTKFLGFPNTNPSSGVSIKREASGYIDLPYIDGGMPLITSNYLRVGINAEDLSDTNSNEFINVDFGEDDGSGGLNARTNTDLGDFLAGTKTIRLGSNAGIASVNLGLRVNLHRDSTTNTETPKLKDVEIDYTKEVPTIEQFAFEVDIAATADAQGLTEEGVITLLETARDLGTLPILTYGNVGNKYVSVSVEWLEEFTEDVDIAPDTLAQRTGFALVTCREVLN